MRANPASVMLGPPRQYAKYREHGDGCECQGPEPDIRATTHSVKQSQFCFVGGPFGFKKNGVSVGRVGHCRILTSLAAGFIAPNRRDAAAGVRPPRSGVFLRKNPCTWCRVVSYVVESLGR